MRQFHRGSGPLVSVLFPTRGRPHWLCEAADSLWSLARDKTLLEFVFKTDLDDADSCGVVERMKTAGIPVTHIHSPRGRGYHDMHLWVNQMSQAAKGDWLIIWNDDARMRTQDWDQELLHCRNHYVWHGVDDVCCLTVRTLHHPGATGFFFLRRKVTEILGRFSPIPHNDTWVTTLMGMVDSLFLLPTIEIEHWSESGDATWNEGIEARRTLAYTTLNPAGRRLKLEDALKLATYIEEYSRANP